MPAISFQEEWLDKLLSCTKQQTTRQQTERIKVGDVCSIYNQQRRRITDKPMRTMTELGREMIRLKRAVRYDIRTYPPVHPDTWVHGRYYAHLLGKVRITEVFDLHLPHHSHRNEWAKADGFVNFGTADTWFTKQYDEQWYRKTWTVIRWDGWQEQYFEPTGEAMR